MKYARDGSVRSDREFTMVAVRVLWVVLVGGLLAALVAAGCQSVPTNGPPDEDDPPWLSDRPARELPALVGVGDEFEIKVTFASPADDFHAIGLTETAPAGWKVTVDVTWADPEAALAHTPEPETATYIWEGPYPAGQEFTAVYKVEVPADAGPGTYTFSGSLRYYIEPHPAPSYEEEIAGDASVTVSS